MRGTNMIDKQYLDPDFDLKGWIADQEYNKLNAHADAYGKEAQKIIFKMKWRLANDKLR
jgi:hypothetical protein